MAVMSFNSLLRDVVRKLVLAKPVTVNGETLNTEIDFNQINSASIDIKLGKFVLVELEGSYGNMPVLDFRRRDKMNTCRIALDPEEGFVIMPGQFILAESEEIFNLPLYLSAEYKLKSSMARIGLEHLNAGWADAGWHGSVLTLELKNMSQYHAIRIRPGDAIGQMVFFRHEEVPQDRSYAARGRYNNDTSVSSIKE